MTKLLGYDSLDTFYFRQPWPLAVLLLLAAVALLGVMFVYGRERALSPALRVGLGALRALLYVLILLLLFEPVGAQTRTVTLPSNVLILLDVSESMDLKDARQRPDDLAEAAHALGKLPLQERSIPEALRAEVAAVPRLDLARGILTHPDLKLFQQPGERYRLRWFSFGERLDPAPEGEAVRDWLGRARASAKATRLGEALQGAVDRYSGQPIAAVVVLTDGASNEGADPVEAARSLNVPIFPVGIGLPRPDDIRLQAVLVSDTVFPKDRVPVRVRLGSTGSYAGRTVDLTLKADGRELDRKTVQLTGAAQMEELAFVPEPGVGTMKLEVAVAPLAGEASQENNRAERLVRVLDEKIKVLYVEGKPRWEYRYLRAVLTRDRRLEVKFLLTEGDRDLANASDQFVARFPEQEADAFRYDLVILGDVPADFFTPAQLEWLEKLVRERGGSFLLLAGPQHAPTSYFDTPVARLLPVKLAAGIREPVDPGVHPVVTPEGAQSLMMALEPSDEETQLVWSLVKPLFDLPRLEGKKPGATVLATLSDRERRTEPYPLVAWQRYGSGKVMFVGTDQLWRLRFKRGDQYHARFWGQAIQFLTLSRLLGENKRIRLEAERKTYQAGERVLLHANVLDPEFNPVTAGSYTVLVETIPPQGEPRAVALKAVPEAPGVYQGFFTPERDGVYRVLTPPQDATASNQVEVQVTAAGREQLEPALQQELLDKVAEASGGKLLGVRDLASLPDLLKDQPRTVALPPREKELWNHGLIFVVLLGCLGAEWFLRRRHDIA